jgi:hypothetical protein
LGEIGVVQDRGSGRDELVEQPGEQLSKDLGTTSQQGVYVATLRNAPPVRRIVGKHIPFDNRDTVVEVGEDPGGEEPAHARTENHRVLTELRHQPLLNLIWSAQYVGGSSRWLAYGTTCFREGVGLLSLEATNAEPDVSRTSAPG